MIDKTELLKWLEAERRELQHQLGQWTPDPVKFIHQEEMVEKIIAKVESM